MLNYAKIILQKVSFDMFLFEKELKKAISWLASNEIDELKHWSLSKFGDVYGTLIQKCFPS